MFTSTLAPAPISTHGSVRTESKAGVSLVGANTQPWSRFPLASSSHSSSYLPLAMLSSYQQ